MSKIPNVNRKYSTLCFKIVQKAINVKKHPFSHDDAKFSKLNEAWTQGLPLTVN